MRRVPGVASAAFTSLLPLTDDTQFGVYGTRFEKDDKSYSVFRYVVSSGYFETMRIPLRRGRFLDQRDTANAPRVMLISESLAKKEFGAQDPIGGVGVRRRVLAAGQTGFACRTNGIT